MHSRVPQTFLAMLILGLLVQPVVPLTWSIQCLGRAYRSHLVERVSSWGWPTFSTCLDAPFERVKFAVGQWAPSVRLKSLFDMVGLF